MSDIAIVSTILGILGTACAIVFGYAAFKRNGKMDNRDEGRESGVVLTELGYIKANTDEIKAEQREQRKVNTELYSRMSAVEASAKQAHLRIDRAEGKQGERERP